MTRNLHRLAEQRSLAIHRVVAERLRDDGAILEKATARVARWLETGFVARPYAEAWQRWLNLPLDELEARITGDDEQARALRQVSPFAGAVSPKERWTIWRQARQEFEEQP